MPFFGTAAASEPCIIVWHSEIKNRLVGIEFDTLGDAEDAWASPNLLFTSCILFLQRPSDSIWIPWRSYGWTSQIKRIEEHFRDPEIRRTVFEDIDRHSSLDFGDLPLPATVLQHTDRSPSSRSDHQQHETPVASPVESSPVHRTVTPYAIPIVYTNYSY